MPRKTSKTPLSNIDSQIAALQQQIEKLEAQRTSALRAELAEAEQRVAEISARFNSGNRAPSAPAKRSNVTRAAAPKKKSGAKRQRSTLTKEERMEALKKIVGNAGSEGISAKKAANEAGLNYVTVLKAMNNAPTVFKQQGEKRDSRYYLK